jgi:hypothetical protein
MSVPTKWFFVLAFIMTLFIGTRAHADEPPFIVFTANTDTYHVDFTTATKSICTKWNAEAGIVVIVRIADRISTWACFVPTKGGFLIASPMTGKSFEMPDSEVTVSGEFQQWMAKKGQGKQL